MLSLIICIILTLAYFYLAIILKKQESLKTKKITDGINKLLLFVPIIVSIIFTILFLTVLKGRLVERTSHALIVLCLWLYGTASYVNILKYFKNKLVLIISIILMIISVGFAIYLTPLDRYVEVMFLFTHEWAYLVGVCMLLVLYFALLKESLNIFKMK